MSFKILPGSNDKFSSVRGHVTRSDHILQVAWMKLHHEMKYGVRAVVPVNTNTYLK